MFQKGLWNFIIGDFGMCVIKVMKKQEPPLEGGNGPAGALLKWFSAEGSLHSAVFCLSSVS